MKAYIAGPMTGIPEYNFPAFREAAQRLRDEGYEVVSPVELDEAESFNEHGDGQPLDKSQYAHFLRRDLDAIADGVDVIVCLPGYENSKGAQVEIAFARSLGIPSVRIDTMQPVANPSGEVRVTNEITGGQKGTKPARFGLLPWDQLWKVAELYGKGAEKYDDNNWRKGYDWSLSIDALGRHFAEFMSGQKADPETGCHPLTSVVFHALALLYFEDAHPELDNRYRAS